MAKQVKCDRCSEVAGLLLSGHIPSDWEEIGTRTGVLELCPKCRAAFTRWLENREFPNV
jgi:hypothetical protein